MNPWIESWAMPLAIAGVMAAIGLGVVIFRLVFRASGEDKAEGAGR